MKIFLLFIFIKVCPALMIFAQENNVEKSIYYGNQVIPKLPDAEKFEIYGKISVNNSKGAPDISIPIYELSADGVTVPITLNYISTGIRVNEVSTAVGLNWFINAGGYISRNINGLADEEDLGWFNVPEEYRPEAGWWKQADCEAGQLKFQAIANYNWDAVPDEFSYNFLDKQGTFFFGRDKACYLGLKNGLKIEFWDKKSITDEYGNIYIFGGSSESQEVNGISVYQEDDLYGTEGRNASGTTGWRLTKIMTKNGHEIDFSYIRYNYSYNFQSGNNFNWRNTYQNSSYTAISSNSRIFTSCNAWASLLSSISVDNKVQVEFFYENDPALNVWKIKLTNIHIHDNCDDQPKIFSFFFDKYSDSRLRLTGFEEQSFNGSLKGKKYSFNYNGNNIGRFGSKSTDRFGYYNGSSGVSNIPDSIIMPPSSAIFSGGRDRDINDSWIAAGILNEIVYPTGGKTKFYYEANKDGEYYSPGVRIWKTEDSDGSKMNNIRRYTYGNLNGYKRQNGHFEMHLKSIPHYLNLDDPLFEETPWYFLSSEEYYDRPGNNHDFFYSSVTIEDLNEAGIPKMKIEEHFEPYITGNSLNGHLKVKKYFKDLTNTIKKEEYKYVGYSDSQINGYISEDNYYRLTEWYCNSGTMKPEYGPVFYYPDLIPLVFVSSIHYLSHSSITEYSEAGALVNNTDFEYNTKSQLSKIRNWISGSSDTITSIFKYADDYHITALESLKTRNIIGIPLDKRTLNKDNLVVGGSISEPDELGNIIRIYEFESVTPVNNNWSNSTLLSNNFNLRVSYKYDQKGNIIEEKNNSLTTSYLWGYQQKYPVAMIKGIAYDEIPSAARAAVSLLEYTPDVKSTVRSLKNQLADLMNDTRYQVTINTYKPLIGISSQTSLNGITIYYEYDSLGRLKSIIDDDGHILKTFEYHYKQ
jgi:YD repeat-containing protein